jgi:hypothetical protein
VRVALERTPSGKRELAIYRGRKAERTVEPLEGTNISLFNTIIPNWWAENGMSTGAWVPGDAALAERVWVANRCIQMNAQQIASMPLVFHGTTEPAWVSSPDPNVFPNGIGDAMFNIVEQIYGHGYSCQYVTDRYSDGFPRTWTVLDSCALDIRWEDGARVYTYGEQRLDPRRIVQIDRNPGVRRAHGTSALSAYAQVAWGLLAASNQAMTVSQGGIPSVALKSARKLDATQAQALQTQWMDATSRRNGAPPVLPPEITFEALSFSPEDLALLSILEFDAKAIMTAVGVPAPLMNMALQGGLTYQNPAALGEMWWRFELRTTATKIANAFSAQMLPRGQWISVDASDTFVPIDGTSTDDDEQASQVAQASPAQQPRPSLAAIGGTG